MCKSLTELLIKDILSNEIWTSLIAKIFKNLEDIYMKNDSDPRVLRTNKSLNEAFIKLLKNYRVEDINVRQITDEADVTRSAFYGHFKDKNEFVNMMVEDAVREIFRPALVDGADNLPIDNVKKHVVSVLSMSKMFDQIANKYDAYTVLLCTPGFTDFKDKFEIEISHWLEKFAFYFDNQLKIDGLPIQVICSFYVHGLTGMVTDWLDKGMVYTPHYMARIAQKTLQYPRQAGELHLVDFFGD